MVGEQDERTVVFLCEFLRGGIGIAVDDGFIATVDRMPAIITIIYYTVGVVKFDFFEI